MLIEMRWYITQWAMVSVYSTGDYSRSSSSSSSCIDICIYTHIYTYACTYHTCICVLPYFKQTG